MTAEPQMDIQTERKVTLTKREKEVINLVFEGKSSQEVADVLVCSKRTVDFHLARIYDKLQVSNRVQAMRQATKLGLIDESLDKKDSKN